MLTQRQLSIIINHPAIYWFIPIDQYAGDMINPKKSSKEVEEESTQKHDQYVKSHEAYEPGEQRKRNYTYQSYDINKCYGVPTPHSNAGIHVNKALHWITEK